MPEFEFRPLTADDFAMLQTWLARPHVAAVWDSPRSLEEIRHEYLPTITDVSSLRAYIVWQRGRPVGFIQSYMAAEAGDGWWPDERDPGVSGIDQFLADPKDLNRGIGTAMVKAFVALLFEDPAITRVQTDPAPDNLRAIRCYEKAGFRRVGEVDTPDGRALLMVCERPPAL
ncbi:MAG: GNAT family N-acetyltransferase [Gemmatimonadaceae bacterium]